MYSVQDHRLLGRERERESCYQSIDLCTFIILLTHKDCIKSNETNLSLNMTNRLR